jgi:hypothetical protein
VGKGVEAIRADAGGGHVNFTCSSVSKSAGDLSRTVWCLVGTAHDFTCKRTPSAVGLSTAGIRCNAIL